MMTINKFILTIIVLTTFLFNLINSSTTTAGPLEFFISLKECSNVNITNTLGSCTMVEGCGNGLKSVLSVEKFTNNYEGRFYNNNDCKGIITKKTIWFECVEGGSVGDGYIVYCDQYPNVPTNSSSVENIEAAVSGSGVGSGSDSSFFSSFTTSSSSSSTTNQVTTSSTTTGQPITTSSSSSGTFSSSSSSSTGFIPTSSAQINIKLN